MSVQTDYTLTGFEDQISENLYNKEGILGTG